MQPAQDIVRVISSFNSSAKLLRHVQTSPTLLHYFSDRKNIVRTVQNVPPLSTLRVLRLANGLGFDVPKSAFECAAHQLAMAKHWTQLLTAVHLGVHARKTSARLLNWRIRALMQAQIYAPLASMLTEFEQCDVKPNRRTFHLLIEAAVRNHDLALTKDLIARMSDHGIPADPSTHAVIAMNYRSFGANPDVQIHALQHLDHLQTNTAISVLNSLLQLRLDANDLDGALELLSFFDQPSVAPILACYTNHRIKGSIHHTLLPNASTFSIFINHTATRADLSTALALFDGMIARGIQPTIGIIVSLINTHFSAGAGTTAVHMVAEMCDQQKSPLDMFVPLMNPDEKWSLPLLTSRFKPSSRVFNALLKGTLQTHGLSSTIHVLRIMHANKVLPNAVTLQILISHLSRVEHAPPATLFRILRSLASKTLRPGLRHLHTILSTVLRHEHYMTYGVGWDATAAPHSKTRSHTIQPPSLHSHQFSSTFDSLGATAGIRLSRKSSYGGSLSRPIFQSLTQRHVRSDGPMFALRIKRDAAIQKDMSTAKDTFQILLIRGLQANEYHFSALMQGFANAGNLQAATSVLTSAIQAGIKPNVVMFTILIVGYARQGKPEDAVKVFQDMLSANIQPDIPSIDAVASAFFAVGAYGTARRSLITMWPYIQPFPDEFRDLTLKELAENFRSMHDKQTPVSRPLSKHGKINLYHRLAALVRVWKTRRLGKKIGYINSTATVRRRERFHNLK